MADKKERLAELDRMIRMRELESQISKMPAAKDEIKSEPDAWYEDFGEGLAVSGMGTWYGIKDLFGAMSDEDRKTLEDWKTDAGESIWGGIGQGVGEVAQIALPGGAALKGAKALGKAKRALPFLTDVAASAGHGALQATDVGETRLSNALGGGASAVAGSALARTLSKPFRGIKIDNDAKEMIEKGVRLTPGQSASGGLTQAMEQLGQWKIFTGKGVQRARQNAMQDWNLMTFKAATPPGKSIDKIGPEGVSDLKKAFDESYSQAWEKASQPTQVGTLKMWFKAIDAGNELNKESQDVLAKLLNDIKSFTFNYSPQKVVQFDKKLRKKINSAFDSNNRELGLVLKEMKMDLRKAIGNDFADQIKGIDDQYAKYRTIVKASSSDSALEQGGVFTPKQLISASKRVAGEDKAAMGMTPLRKEYLQGASTVGRKEYKPLIDMRKALVMNSPDLTAGAYQPFGMALMGMTNPQKALKKKLSPLAEMLRNSGYSSASFGGAFLDTDY